MTDQEYLKLAAKAAGGIDSVAVGNSWDGFMHLMVCWEEEGEYSDWNPLIDDGDAFRLAASLELEITVMNGFGEVWCEDRYGIYRARSEMSDDRAKDYRNAIVWCAAEIGADLK